MNSKENNPLIIVDVKDIVWNILSQWKAVVLFALIISLAVTALKYNSDINKYKAEIDKQATKAEEVSLPVEESINKVLDTLSYEDRMAVELLINQREWIDTETEYVNNSILLNTDPTSQRTLTLDYNISAVNSDDEELTSLVYSYSAYLKSEEVINSLRQIIDPIIENKYITELLIVLNDGYGITYSKDATLLVRVVLPDDVDASEIEQVITSQLSDYSDQLKRTVCNHSIGLIQSSVICFYNADAVSKRTNTMNSITGLKNNANTMESALSSGQRAALNEIKSIKEKYNAVTNNSNASANDESIVKPRISKKYVVVGFLLGMLIYAFIYVLNAVLRNRVLSGSHIDNYVDGRVLGEVHQREKKGSPLFYSKTIDKIRYRGSNDVDKQIQKILSAVNATCKHAGVENVSLFCLQNKDEDTGIVNRIAEGLKEDGINSSVIIIREEVDEKEYLDMDNVLCVICDDCKVPDVINIAQRFNDYDIKQIGYIYVD